MSSCDPGCTIGLHRFGQSTVKGVYRWLVLSLIAYFLAHLACLWSAMTTLPDWAVAARLARETLLPSVVVLSLLISIKRYQHLVRTQGLNISVTGWQLASLRMVQDVRGFSF